MVKISRELKATPTSKNKVALGVVPQSSWVNTTVEKTATQQKLLNISQTGQVTIHINKDRCNNYR